MYLKEKEAIKETSQEADIKNRHQTSKCRDSGISKRINLNLNVYYIEHKLIVKK